MPIEFVHIDSAAHIGVEDDEIEFGPHPQPLDDPRLGVMPEYVYSVVIELFHGNVDEALFQSTRLVQNRVNPPNWALWLIRRAK